MLSSDQCIRPPVDPVHLTGQLRPAEIIPSRTLASRCARRICLGYQSGVAAFQCRSTLLHWENPGVLGDATDPGSNDLEFRYQCGSRRAHAVVVGKSEDVYACGKETVGDSIESCEELRLGVDQSTRARAGPFRAHARLQYLGLGL